MDKQIILDRLISSEIEFKNLPKVYRSDRDIVCAAVGLNGNNIQYVQMPLCNDKEIILKALETSENVCSYMDFKFFDDEDVVLALLKHSECYLDMASIRIYKMCINKDPIKVLSSVIESRNLEHELNTNKTTVKKIKI